jgi:hypothetical protein
MLADRCDLLALWKNETAAVFHLIAIEVKASDSDQLDAARLTHAAEQLQNTLEAVDDGLAAATLQPRSPLSIPRCEMLKQTLARAAQTHSGDAALDRANRLCWGGWLVELFTVETGKTAPPIQTSGLIVSVLLRRETAGTLEPLRPAIQWPIAQRILGLPEIDELLNWEPSVPSATAIKPPSPVVEPAPVLPAPEPVAPLTAGNFQQEVVTPTDEIPPAPLCQRGEASPPSVTMAADRILPVVKPASPVPAPATDLTWPPPVNALGLIGQSQAVDLLVKQAQMVKALGERFPDKLLVGPAGVGKSTLARNIGALLLNHEPLFFSGSDLRRPADLLERLTQEGLDASTGGNRNCANRTVPDLHRRGAWHFRRSRHRAPQRPGRPAQSLPSKADSTTSTSAVFLLATTDPGKLSEAFQSRPSKTCAPPLHPA